MYITLNYATGMVKRKCIHVKVQFTSKAFVSAQKVCNNFTTNVQQVCM